jgi:hypothetical protein
MNTAKKRTAYTKDELNMALPAYGFVVVYLLALIPNDYRLIVMGVIGTILIPRLRRWYGSLNMTAFLAMILLQPPADPDPHGREVLSDSRALLSEDLPGPFSQRQRSFQMHFRGDLPPSEEWTFIISYLGLVAVGAHGSSLPRTFTFRRIR